MADKALTAGTISLAVTIIGGWLWATTYFMVRADADDFHESISVALEEAVKELKKSDRTSYLELKIDQSNTEMAFIEQAGIADVELRQYELLKFSVERMTHALLELDGE